MSATTVSTVLGPVEVGELGAVDAHDHLLLDWSFGPTADADLRLDDRDEATAEAAAFRDAGGGTIVDAMPTGVGRDVDGLMEVSRRSGVHVVATCGYHKSAYYPPSHWARRYGPDEQFGLLLDELTHGIDRHDYTGPLVQRTHARPGVLKCATSHNAADRFERACFEVVAALHSESGLPVMTHTDHGTYAHEQLDLLERSGVPPSAIALSHMDRNPDPVLHATLARRGAFLIYDGVGRERYRPLCDVVRVIRTLCDDGLESSLILGADVARRSLRTAAGGPGVAGLFTSHVHALHQAGFTHETVQTLLVGNPARWLVGSHRTIPSAGTNQGATTTAEPEAAGS